MISYELLRDEGILVVEPQGKLEAADFAALTREVDPYIEENGRLRGLLIQSESFPGWGDFGALISHLGFIRDHHRDIGRVAAVTDSTFLSIAPRIACASASSRRPRTRPTGWGRAPNSARGSTASRTSTSNPTEIASS